MSKNKITVDFKVFEKYAEQLDKLGGDLKTTAEEILQDSHDMVTTNVEREMKKHNKSGETDRAILRNSKVVWQGNIGSIDIGFDIANGGLPSIFLMYGTPKHEPNHPGTEEDQALYDAIYGSKIKRQIRQMMEWKLQDAIQEKLGD